MLPQIPPNLTLESLVVVALAAIFPLKRFERAWGRFIWKMSHPKIRGVGTPWPYQHLRIVWKWSRHQIRAQLLVGLICCRFRCSGRGGREGQGRGRQWRWRQFVKMYSHGELGEKLRKLRPSVEEVKKEGETLWFSLSELNERLMKLREMEEKDTELRLRIGGISFKDLRESLDWMRQLELEKAKKNSG